MTTAWLLGAGGAHAQLPAPVAPVQEVEKVVRDQVKGVTGADPLPSLGSSPAPPPAARTSSAPPSAGAAPAGGSPQAPAGSPGGAPGGGGSPSGGSAGSPGGAGDGAGGGGTADSGRSSAGAARRTAARPTPAGQGIGEGRNARSNDEDDALQRIVEVVPGPVKAIIGALVAFALVVGIGSLVVARRARRFKRQRGELLEEVGVLQHALLPEVPDNLGPLAASVAYRPAEGPGAGGDFYDVFALQGGRVAVLVGDMSGHGRDALAPTTLMRYTLRAYLDAGLPPRRALQLGGRVLDNELGGEFATVVLAVYDPADGTLSYACAGHPVPVVLGPSEFDPVTVCSSPPLGMEIPTGRRETTVALPAGALACFYTDGLIEARTNRQLVGRPRLIEMIREIGASASAQDLLDRLAEETDAIPDDMAVCLISPSEGKGSTERIEELDLERADLERYSVEAFLEACGVPAADVAAAVDSARETADSFGGATLRVSIGEQRAEVSVLPRVEDGFPIATANPPVGPPATAV